MKMSSIIGTSILKVRAQEKFKISIRQLKDAIPAEISAELGRIKFPDVEDFEHYNIEDKTTELERMLENIIRTRTDIKRNSSSLTRRKMEEVMVRWFKASYPFGNLILTVAKEGANVSPIILSLFSLLTSFL